MRVGAIDCGTNSLRLLVADLDGHGGLRDVVRRMEVVRLGQDIDTTGVIAPEAMARTLAVTRTYAAQCREHRVEAVRFVATSASRDARNAAEFVAGVRAAFGDLDVAPEVVSGTEEAELAFAGATGDLRAEGVAGPYLAVDLGGGSTELVRGSEHVEATHSADIGSVRMTERHLHSDPPTASERAAAAVDIRAALERALDSVPADGIATVVGLAGTITTVTAYALGLTAYDPCRVHHARLAPRRHREACERILAMTREERMATPVIHPGRVDVIGAGALVWECVLERVLRESPHAEVVTSEHDILDGIALSAGGPVAG